MTSRLDTQSVLRRLSAFVAKAEVRYDTDGSIVVDGRLSLDMATRNEIRSKNAASGAFDSRWLRLASLHDMSWLLDKNGLPHDVACIRINGDVRTLADAVLWEWIEHGLIRFVPVGSLRTKPSSTRRHIGKFCVALVSNYPELFLRPLE
ncbi:hypothetical protein CCR75_001920 [Bremia lactucae]|uniref:Uncharacterized protein n=1 Tax=Bremia lactucae TaxID=4779 RepID=A0A976FI44_BRELC|nr:hypothetical protein CCR75_001920 [Bremia lactucae]